MMSRSGSAYHLVDIGNGEIEQAEALGEPPEDPLLLYSTLYGVWVAHLFAFNGDTCRDVAARFLALAKKQGATVPLMIGHRLMGPSLLFTGDFAESRAHLDCAFALYDPAEHRPLATRFGQDVRVAILCNRSLNFGYLAIPRPRSQTAMTQTRMRGKWVKPPR